MKLASCVAHVLIGFIGPFGLFASGPEPTGTSLPANDPVQIELEVIAKAHQAARSGDEATVNTLFATSTALNVAPSILLARRAMGVCGRLQNDNEYANATKLAQRVLKRLAGMKENNDQDRAERLYWEALLEGRILDHKAVAIERLDEAAKFTPNDGRVLDLKRDLAASVARFGR